MNITKCIAIASLLLVSPLTFAQKAIVEELNLPMVTYGFSDPDPVPRPDNLYYPYFRFDGFSNKGVEKEWKQINLENDFIKVTLFPEIGGKVWGAIDKTRNKEFVYYNHVVKFRDIAMRGPWVSGGIEFNFGIIGHAPTSASPVDYLTLTKEDGSVSCYISSYEYITRTMWTVEINLPKDKAYFTTQTTWYNSSSLDQPYYQWMNAGYKAAGNPQFCYPGIYKISHSGIASPFPVDQEGRDLSWYNNLAFGKDKSYHVMGKYNDFYGIYWHDDNFGSVHHASYSDKLGMKIFLWSLSREGSIWEDLLTDGDGQYIELQSGRMYNQPATVSAKTPYKHTSFAAGQTDHWIEYWYPVAGTKGIVKGNHLGALNVEKQGERVKLLFSPTQDIKTTLSIYADGNKIISENIALHTLKTWEKTFLIGKNIVESDLKIIIGESDLIYSELPEDNIINRPNTIPVDFDWKSAYGLYISGEQWMNQKIYDRAEKDLNASLKKDKYFIPTLVRLASLYHQLGRYEESLELCRTALSINAYDGESNYIYGLNNARLGNLVDAKDGFSLAVYSISFRSAAYVKLAAMYAIDKDWKKVVEYAEKSLETNISNLDAQQTLLLAYRKLGKTSEAKELIAKMQKQLPLNHLARYEAYLINKTDPSRKDFERLITNELPEETFMELATWYEFAGCTEEAVDLLSFVPNYPIACYYKAWLLDKNGDKEAALSLLKQADNLSPQLVFPFRPENMPALVWASSNSHSWKPLYYQAILSDKLTNKNKAKELLGKCDKVDYMPFYLYKASLSTGEAQLHNLLEAEKISKDWRVGSELIKYYTTTGDWQKADKTAAQYNKLFPKNYIVGLQYAKTLCETRQYDKCVTLLEKIEVLPNEGAYAGRELYRDANLFRAMNYIKSKKPEQARKAIEKSKVWIENLGVGKPYEDLIDYRLENYLEAMTHGDTDESKRLLKIVADGYDNKKETVNSIDLLSALAKRESGDKVIADRWVDGWKLKYANDSVIQKYVSIYQNDAATSLSSSIDKDGNSDDATPWERTAVDYNSALVFRVIETLK